MKLLEKIIIIRLSTVGGIFSKDTPQSIQNGFLGYTGPKNTIFGEKSDFPQESIVFQAKFLLRIFRK